jgi:uncharacterized protein (DUF58 family)
VSKRVPLPAEDVYGRVRALRLRIVRKVRTLLAGAYRSAFRGPGIEFLEFAPYQPGDDVRRIDWLVSARRNRPYVRRHAEERELKVLLVLDASASMNVGPAGRTACDLVCTLAAAVGLSAAWNGDRTGGFLFGGDRVEAVPFRRGERHVLRILSRLMSGPAYGRQTDLRPVLRRVRAIRGHLVVLLLSDFLTSPAPSQDEVLLLLAACARKHNVLAVHVTGPSPGTADAFLAGADAESGRVICCDADLAGGDAHARRTRDALSHCHVRHASIGLADDWLVGLADLLGGPCGDGALAY